MVYGGWRYWFLKDTDTDHRMYNEISLFHKPIPYATHVPLNRLLLDLKTKTPFNLRENSSDTSPALTLSLLAVSGTGNTV